MKQKLLFYLLLFTLILKLLRKSWAFNWPVQNHRSPLSSWASVLLCEESRRTGTAAMRVGCRTLVSPLLPFLIFDDFSWGAEEKNKKKTTKQLHRSELNRWSNRERNANRSPDVPGRPESEARSIRSCSRETRTPALHSAPAHGPAASSRCTCPPHCQHGDTLYKQFSVRPGW